MRFGFGLHTLQLSLARQGLLGVVCGPAHGPRVDVVQLAVRAWTPGIVAPSVLERHRSTTRPNQHVSRATSRVGSKSARVPS